MSGRADLQGYIRHVDLYGPDCVVETAAQEGMSDKHLGELRGYIAHRQRTQEWVVGRAGHSGGSWKDRRSARPRPCEHCGLDLPAGARANMRFHPHCASAAARQRASDRDKRETGGTGR